MAKSSKSQKNKNMATSKKGNGKPMTAAPVTTTDLTLTESGGVLSCNLTDNAQWGGIQKFVDQTSNVGAVAIAEAQRNYSTVATGKETHCNVDGAGSYRAWCSDFDYNVHTSNWVVIP